MMGKNSRGMAYVLVLVMFALHSLRPVEAQINQQLINSLVGSIIDRMNSQMNNQGQRPRCIPWRPPSGFSTLQDYCQYLSVANDSYWEDKYRNGIGPSTPNSVIPLSGCVLGCIVGRNSYNNAELWGAGAWSGKCIRNDGTRVVNLLTPLPSIGGMMNVLDTFNWSSFLPVTENYPGTVAVGSSWWDAFNSLPNGGWVKDVWTITYDDVQPPSVNGNSSTLERTINMYAQLVRGSRDEIRMIEPGFMLGQVFRRPNSFLNPTPIPFNSNVRFALFQMCDRYGNYASGGNRRYFQTFN